MTPYQAVGMKSLPATIRAAGATNVILIAGRGWSCEVDGWLAVYLGVHVHDANSAASYDAVRELGRFQLRAIAHLF